MRLWTLVALLGVSACSINVSSSNLKHDADNPVVDGGPGLWSTETQAEYVHTVQPMNWGAFDPALDESSYLPETHPMTLRLQYWATRLDETLRQRYPGLLENVPTPKVAVLNTDDINAYVGDMPVCFDNVVLRFGENAVVPFPGTGGAYYEGQIFDPSDGLKHLACRHQTVTFTELLAQTNHYNNTDHLCKLLVKIVSAGKFEVRPSDGCLVDQQLKAKGALESFVAMQTAQHVTVFSGILRSMSEDQMVAILYHELGHYYHGHAVDPQGRYGFFFHLAGSNDASQPQEALDLKPLNAELTQAKADKTTLDGEIAQLKARMPKDVFPKIAGQKLNTALFPAVRHFVLMVGTSDLCPDASQIGLLRFTGEEGIVGPITAAEEASYLTYETKALACMAKFTIVHKKLATDDPAAKTSVTATEFFAGLNRVNNGVVTPFLRALVPQGSVADYFVAASAILDAQMPAYYDGSLTTMAFVKSKLDQAKGAVSVAEAKLAKFDDTAKQQQIGFYTYEEEADDLSAEWLALVGFNPKVGGDADMVFIKFFSEPADAAKCQSDRDAQWKTPEGEAIILPWGSMNDPHPGDCFRVRNYDKEVLAHNYPTPATSPTDGLTPTWTDLVASIGGPLLPAPNESPTAVHGDSRRGMARCRFMPK